ncbi:MAG: transcriptional regulator [Anaerolineae bacterium]
MERGERQVAGRVLHVNLRTAEHDTSEVFHALASPQRLQILHYLCGRTANVSEIAHALGLPLSTTTMHVSILERAGLVRTEMRPAARGQQKVCSRAYDVVIVDLPAPQPPVQTVVELTMPVGHYMECEVTPSCGLCDEEGVIGQLDCPASFFLPERVNAQLLWFSRGYVEYRFPNPAPQDAVVESLQFSAEMCSEAPLHHRSWPSDITLWINGVEVGTWTSPADFGGERGRFTPDWWLSWSSQYGLLKLWQVDREGTFVDDQRVSDVTIEQLNLGSKPYISVRIGVKPDAPHPGGLNLFGQRFGNHPQDLILRLRLQEG